MPGVAAMSSMWASAVVSSTTTLVVWMGLMTTIYIADAFWTAEDHEQYWWSIVLPDGTPRLAFAALRDMEK